MSQRFESKRDTWLVVLGLSTAAISVAGIMPILGADIDATIKLVTAGLVVLTVVLISWVYLSTYYYVVEANELRIRSGPFRWRIALVDIHRVSPTRAPWSSPALSLDRLCVEYGDGKRILLSPQRREEFIHALGVSVT